LDFERGPIPDWRPAQAAARSEKIPNVSWSSTRADNTIEVRRGRGPADRR